MARKHFDVVVLGAGLGSLFAAALLARRSFRVRVLGQRWIAPRYSYFPARIRGGGEGTDEPSATRLSRRPFQLLCHGSPVLARFLLELAQTQTLRRSTRFRDPMFQVFLPDSRLDVVPDAERFRDEIHREFPDVDGAVDDLYTLLASINGRVDSAFDRQAVLPPVSFWERRAARKIEGELAVALRGPDLLSAFPEGHPYRQVPIVTAAFGSDYGSVLPPIALARLHGAWTRGVVSIAGGEEGLLSFLVERIRAHGGEVSLDERAVRLITTDDRVTHVEDDSGEEAAGCDHVLFEGALPELLDLATRFAPKRADLDAYPELEAPEGRFVVSIEVARAGLPESLAENAFLLPGVDEDAAPVWVQRSAGSSPDSELLVAETLLPVDAVLKGRRFVLGVLERHFPFVEHHYRVVDSPHDGLPLWDFRLDYEGSDADIRLEVRVIPYGRRDAQMDDVRYFEVERTALVKGGGSRDPEPLRPRWVALFPETNGFAPLPAGLARLTGRMQSAPTELGWAGLAAQPLQTPLANVWMAGDTVFPTLGQEGELLAAWSVASRITASDPHKERLRKELWSKLEIK
jgi:phytoene dehydrogenase-like protein